MLKSFRIILILAIIISINILGHFLSMRMDFTEGNIYTLSSSTKEVVQSLDEDIRIRVFMSETLPPQAEIIRQELVDKLNEYKSISQGKLRITYEDPTNNPELKQLAQLIGIPELQLNIIEKDKQQSVKAFMGLAIIKENPIPNSEDANPLASIEKSEVIPVIQSLSNFEYDLTAGILKVSSIDMKSIGFLTGHNEHSLAEVSQFTSTTVNPRADYNFAEALSKNYNVTTVSLSEENKSIENIDTLIIAGAQSLLADFEIEAIQSFISNGGNTIFLIDTVHADQGLLALPIQENFDSILNEYGINLPQLLIADGVHANARFSQGFMTYAVPYPYWMKVTTNSLNKDNAITNQLEGFVLPWASPINVKETEGVTSTILATSSPYYQKITEDFDLNPQYAFEISNQKQEPLPVAVMVQKENEGKIIVIGDSDFAAQNFTGMFPSNTLFFQNIVDNLTLGDTLINIRSKGATDRPILNNISESTKNIIRWGNMIIIPFLFIIYGMIRRQMRLKKKTQCYLDLKHKNSYTV